jgi:hypoxanthine phosphoribosyltransferase
LRVAEHAWLTRRRTGAAAAIPHAFSAGEVAALRVWLTGAGRRLSLLVVDDAVDSGATLSRVLAAVAGLAPPGTEIRSAVIAVTTKSPCVEPTYALYRQRLCRFPWSIDAPTPTPS